jgi:uncharacterized protein (TIGR03067 family)
MRQSSCLVLINVSILACTCVLAFAQDEENDRKKLQGSWEVREFVMNGNPIPEEERSKIKIVFLDDSMKLTGPEGIGTREYKYKLDSSKVPKAIDTIPQDGPFAGKIGPAIYELKDDTLRLCIPNRETNDRPKEFKAPKGSELGLIVLKKSKSLPQ